MNLAGNAWICLANSHTTPRLTKSFVCLYARQEHFSSQLVHSKSKDPRKLEFWSILCRSPILTSCSKQVGQASEFDQESQILVQKIWVFPRTETTHPSCTTSASAQMLSLWRIFFLISHQNFHCCNLWALLFVILLCTSKSLMTFPLQLPLIS